MIGSRIANGLLAAATPTTTTTRTASARAVRTTTPTVEQPDAHHVLTENTSRTERAKLPVVFAPAPPGSVASPVPSSMAWSAPCRPHGRSRSR
ncbi:hypothetical protein ACF1D3_30965 [Streptomyces sp. NPDC014728]|uniref:hypothetical protein n=1 Tax=unclassified Streptomyces TaxID=2593676 RepID=UPI003701BBA4